MRKLLLSTLLALASLGPATPALAAPTQVTVDAPQTAVTVGQKLLIDAVVTQPQGDPDPAPLVDAPVTIQAAPGFSILRVDGGDALQANSGSTDSTWTGTLNLDDGGSTGLHISLRAGAATQAAGPPVTVTIAGQVDSDPSETPPPYTFTAADAAIVAPAVTVTRVDDADTVFQGSTFKAKVKLSDVSGYAWDKPLSVAVSTDDKLSITATDGGVGFDENVWTPPFLGANGNVTLFVTLAVAEDATIGTPLSITATPSAGDPASLATGVADQNPVLKLTGPGTQEFPGGTQPVTVKVSNTSKADWTHTVPVQLTFGAGLSLKTDGSDLPAGVSTDGVWTAPALAAGKDAFVKVLVNVATNAAAGSVAVGATTAHGQAATPYAIVVAPFPAITITPGAPIVRGGAPGYVTVRIANSATISAGELGVVITLPPGLSLASSVPSKGRFDGTKWTVSIGDQDSATLKIYLSAPVAQSVDGNMVVDLDLEGSDPLSQQIVTTPKTGVPTVAVTVPSTPVFPTGAATVSIQLANTSSENWTARVPVTLTLPAGFSVIGTVPDLNGLVWTPPAPGRGTSVTLNLTLKVPAGAPAGDAVITASAAGGTADTGAVPVAPAPTLDVSLPDAPLAEGGASDIVVVTLINSAMLSTGPVEVALTVPAGLTLVNATTGSGAQFIDGVWRVTVARQSSAVLKLTVHANGVPADPLVFSVGKFGLPSVSKMVAVTPNSGPGTGTSVPVTTPVITPAVVPPAPVVVPTPTPAAPVKDALSLVLAVPRRVGTAYTFRGELKYQARPLAKAACAASTLQLELRKMKGSKPASGKPADRVNVALVYVEGHCLFGTRYAFFKRYKGQGYRFAFTAKTKVALPVQTGGKAKKASPVTVNERVTVGK